jgi:hypothetical protein
MRELSRNVQELLAIQAQAGRRRALIQEGLPGRGVH